MEALILTVCYLFVLANVSMQTYLSPAEAFERSHGDLSMYRIEMVLVCFFSNAFKSSNKLLSSTDLFCQALVMLY